MVTSRKNLSVAIDWLSIVFESSTASQVMKLVAFNRKFFRRSHGHVKHKAYEAVYTFGAIKIYGDARPTEDNPYGLGAYLVASGKGCQDLYMYLRAQHRTFETFLADCLKLGAVHLTRLDIAVDDTNEKPFFTIEQLYKKCQKKEYYCRNRCHKMIVSNRQDEEPAQTLYIGSSKSEILYRFYDKDKELAQKYDSPAEHFGSIKRTEIQLKDKKAHAFAVEMSKQERTLGSLTFALIKSTLLFLVPDEDELDKKQWKTCQFWERFLGQGEGLELKIESRPSDLLDTQKWLLNGGCLSAVKMFELLKEHQALGYLEDIETLKKSAFFSDELLKKAEGHLSAIHREDVLAYIDALTNTERCNDIKK